MPMCVFPYLTAMRNVFLDGGERYRGGADVAVNAGFLNGADLGDAKHSVYYAWSPYRDAMRRYLDTTRLPRAAQEGQEVQAGVHLSERALVFDNIAEAAHSGDYREFASLVDAAMKEWGVLDEGTGYVDGRLISDTGEIVFDPDHARFQINTPGCGYFSGAPEAEIALSSKVTVQANNERISLSLLPLGTDSLDDAKEFLLTAMGTTGTDEASYNPSPELMPGLNFTMVRMDGKLYAETLEGSLTVKAESARLTALDPVGREIGEIEGEECDGNIRFVMKGDLPGVQYHLTIG